MPKRVELGWTAAELDQLCAYMETDCYSMAAIGRYMGRSRHSVQGAWQRLVKRMGWQAV